MKFPMVRKSISMIRFFSFFFFQDKNCGPSTSRKELPIYRCFFSPPSSDNTEHFKHFPWRTVNCVSSKLFLCFYKVSNQFNVLQPDKVTCDFEQLFISFQCHSWLMAWQNYLDLERSKKNSVPKSRQSAGGTASFPNYRKCQDNYLKIFLKSVK